ncbi:hypothetical protein GCM10010306_031320 [Streptomyces umbrinus]|nr:hypothetical protein GCM10010306_031320 [Streptomyces umbrinus]GHH36208.1 hypothetical protein GCM10018775_11950 [Streptomyces umbrinus]
MTAILPWPAECPEGPVGASRGQEPARVSLVAEWAYAAEVVPVGVGRSGGAIPLPPG